MERHRDFLAVLGYFYLRHDRPAKAAALFAVLDIMAPGDPVVMKSRALALVGAGRAAEALGVLDRLEALGEGGASVHLIRAQALTAAGRAEEAEAAVGRFLAARPAA